MIKKQLVVIGNGMAGIRTVEELLNADPEQYEITVFGSEPYGNYNRILLSSVLCGEKEVDQIMMNDRNWYAENGITLHAGPEKAIESIDRTRRTVIAKDGTSASYDRLLIATGSHPFIIPLPGADLEGVIAFRDIYDVKKMLHYASNHQHAIVLGGGLLGLEAANGLTQQGMNVTVVHNMEWLLNRQLDETAAGLLQRELEARGVRFILSADTKAIVGDDSGHVSAVTFGDGSSLPCDLFVMAVGVKPNCDLAKSAGLPCERGILVTDTLQTYDPRIYAVGECIQHRGDTFGMVAPLFEQAKVCANHLFGHGVATFKTLPTATKLKVTGVDLFSVGHFMEDESCETLLFTSLSDPIYKKLVIKNNYLIGAVLYGESSQGGWYQRLIEEEIDISAMRPLLMFGEAYAWPLYERDEQKSHQQRHQQKGEKVA